MQGLAAIGSQRIPCARHSKSSREQIGTLMVCRETRRLATRFPIVASLLFREHGQAEWHPASTVNLSHSGVLFRTDGPLPGTGHAVDVVITLPLNGVVPAPQVRCTGHVVRIAPQEPRGGDVVAMTIDSYAFEVPV